MIQLEPQPRACKRLHRTRFSQRWHNFGEQFFASGTVTASAIVGDLIAHLEGNLGHTPRAIPTPARTDYTPEVFAEV